MKKTKFLTVASLMAALCVAIHALGSVVETADFSLSVLSGLLVLCLATEYGDRMALSVYLVGGLLSLLLPGKTPAVFFLGFFGWYPVVQKIWNRLPLFWARLVKFAVFNVVLALYLVLSSYLVGGLPAKYWYAVILLFANACFYLYDLLLDRFVIFYYVRIRPRLRFK